MAALFPDKNAAKDEKSHREEGLMREMAAIIDCVFVE